MAEAVKEPSQQKNSTTIKVAVTRESLDTPVGISLGQEDDEGPIFIAKILPISLFVGTSLREGMRVIKVNTLVVGKTTDLETVWKALQDVGHIVRIEACICTHTTAATTSIRNGSSSNSSPAIPHGCSGDAARSFQSFHFPNHPAIQQGMGTRGIRQPVVQFQPAGGYHYNPQWNPWSFMMQPPPQHMMAAPPFGSRQLMAAGNQGHHNNSIEEEEEEEEKEEEKEEGQEEQVHPPAANEREDNDNNSQNSAATNNNSIGDDDNNNNHPARVHPNIKTISQCWQEYMHGIGSNKPARLFTGKERRCRTYYRRSPIYKLLADLVNIGGKTPSTAIHLVETVYPHMPVLAIAKDIQKRKLAGTLHPTLRVAELPAPSGPMRVEQKHGDEEEQEVEGQEADNDWGNNNNNIDGEEQVHKGACDNNSAAAGGGEEDGHGPARLYPNIKTVSQCWQEYMYGIDGNKPARLFTHQEIKLRTYHRRAPIYKLIADLVNIAGKTPSSAIRLVETVYPPHEMPMLAIAKDIRKRRVEGTLHPTLKAALHQENREEEDVDGDEEEDND